ncbi:MAG TPA: cupin domain-containing protein [Bryobacteraceae bacterium]|nr:cupin domain-containing protein [Bryobacteraceae bacterium]
MKYSRRDLSLLLPALAAATAAAQSNNKKLPSKAYRFEDLPVKGHSRAVLNGETHSGFPLELHITQLEPGQAPHPPHHHVHEEVLLLQEGTLDATINGKTTRVGPGSVIYLASNDEHGWRNAGDTRAQYFVFALGSDK